MNTILDTKDESPTIYSEQFDQTYHSIHGAITESKHVFIQYGLAEVAKLKSKVSIFEMGYGTGLNAALTWQYAEENNLDIQYTSVELYPIESQILDEYKTKDEALNQKLSNLNLLNWNQIHSFPLFQINKLETSIHDYNTDILFDLIYYDAFSPNAQPDLWTEVIFAKMHQILNPNGRLTTYCSKGDVKRTLKSCNFTLSNPPGPMGKREMTVAVK